MEDNAGTLSDLFHALVRPGGARITLVLGAGCSVEPPTELDSGPQVAKNAYDQLVNDGVLPSDTLTEEGQWDLTKVAGAVVEQSQDGSQRELTRRLPVDEFIHATPNEGHLITAALMRENAIAYVLTLNFDKAMSHAIAEVSAGSEITPVWGRERQAHIQPPCLIYLHGTADSDQENWVITLEALEELGDGEEDQWEELAALQALLQPFGVFVGLGSIAPVLTSTIEDVQEHIQDGAILQVDTASYDSQIETEESFTNQADISESEYYEMSWCEFMCYLGERMAQRQIQETAAECENQNQDPTIEDGLRRRVQQMLNRGGGIGLLELGNIRANWLCRHNLRYLPHEQGNVVNCIAVLLLILDLIEQNRNCTAVIKDDGVVDFYSSTSGAHHLASVQLVHGRGNKWWSNIDAKVLHNRQRKSPLEITGVVGTGLEGDPNDITPPEDIADLRRRDDDSDLFSPPTLEFMEGITLHRNPDEISRLFDIDDSTQ